MDEHTGYVCHECCTALEAIPGLSMLWCRRCAKRRRVPTHPAFMLPWRWEQTLDERRRTRARFATPSRV